MKLPEGLTETDVMAAIENAVRILCPSFVFGIYDVDDIKQEARMFGLDAIGRYDPQPDAEGRPTRPLENFVYTHIRNRLCNLKRNKFRRTDCPCRVCVRAEGRRTEHADGQFCQKFLSWKRRNDAKASLMRPLDLDHVPDRGEESTRLPSEVEETAETRELLALIDRHLDVELRSTYLQMRAGQSVPKSRRQAVEAAVGEIVREALACE